MSRTSVSQALRQPGLLAMVALLFAGCGPGVEEGEPRWTTLGDSASGYGLTGRATYIATISLAMDSHGDLYHAWSDTHSGTWQIYLRRYRGGAWEDLGAGQLSTPNTISRLGRLLIDTQDRPWLCWFEHNVEDDPVSRRIFVRRYEGQLWRDIGASASGAISGNANVWWPQLALLRGDRPVVAWERYNSDQTVGGAIHLRRLDDDSWGDVGSSTSGAGVSEGTTNAQHVSVRAHGDSVHLLWRVSDERPDASFRQDLRYRRLGGDTWHLLEDIGGSTAARPKGSMALTASGWPVIVWQQATADGYEIRAARRREEGWSSLGSVSAGFREADQPSVAVGPSGAIYVAFQARDDLGQNIHLRHLDGDRWSPVGDSEPHGVSRSASPSAFPITRLVRDRLYVAWHETVRQDPVEVAAYMRYLELP